MRCEWFKKQMGCHYKNSEKKSHRLYAIGPLEITLIVVAVVLVFGVGKLANVGGALGKSIREFRREKGKLDDVPKLTTRETREESSDEPEAKSNEESKD